MAAVPLRQMSRSPLQVARVTLAQAARVLPPYACKNSRHDFTLPQLVTLIVLKQIFKLDYRGLTAWLADWSDLRTALQLAKVPHFTTVQKAAQRLAKKGGACDCWISSARVPKNCS
jgi:hypothetical protein